MQERSNHYSNKSRHLERSIVNKLLKRGTVVCKSEISFCGRRHAKRMPDDGKR